MAITFQALFVMVATRKRAFVIAITAKVRRSGYTASRVYELPDGPVLSSVEAGVKLLIVYGVACFAPSAHGVKDDFY